MTPLQRAQMAKHGVPLDSTEAQRRQAVLELSVYNALSKGLRRDATVPEVVGFLLGSWAPRWGPAGDVVTLQTVADAAKRLQAAGFVRFDGQTVGIPVRDARKRGRPLAIDYSAGKVVPQ